MKQIFYQLLIPILFRDDESEYQEQCKKLEKMITKINFTTVYRILQIPLNAFPAPDLKNIQLINDLRNSVAHAKNIKEITYKGRKPFCDADAFAQIYLEAWAIRKELRHFHERMIEDPKAYSQFYAEFYYKNRNKMDKDKQIT